MSPGLGLGGIELPDQLEGSRAWRAARKRLGKGSTWERLFRPSTFRSWRSFRKVYKQHWVDLNAIWLTEVGQVVAAIVSVLFPPAGIAFAAVAVAMEPEEQKVLAAEMLIQQLRACAELPPEECPTSAIQESMIYAEYVYGTTLSLTDSGELSPQAAQILSKFLEDGGEEGVAMKYLEELDNLRAAAAKGKFDHHVASAGARLPNEVNR